jgi:hypothetical protein
MQADPYSAGVREGEKKASARLGDGVTSQADLQVVLSLGFPNWQICLESSMETHPCLHLSLEKEGQKGTGSVI